MPPERSQGELEAHLTAQVDRVAGSVEHLVERVRESQLTTRDLEQRVRDLEAGRALDEHVRVDSDDHQRHEERLRNLETRQAAYGAVSEVVAFAQRVAALEDARADSRGEMRVIKWMLAAIGVTALGALAKALAGG